MLLSSVVYSGVTISPFSSRSSSDAVADTESESEPSCETGATTSLILSSSLVGPVRVTSVGVVAMRFRVKPSAMVMPLVSVVTGSVFSPTVSNTTSTVCGLSTVSLMPTLV